MTTAELLPMAPELSADDYVVLGLATCFIKDDGEIHPVKIVEPIPSAALEALLKGIATSYEFAHATTLGNFISEGQVQLPDVFPTDAQLCDQFSERVASATRTYRNRHESTASIPLGTTYREFNFSLDRKRVLNSERIVKSEDNVKQHEYTHKVL